MHLCPPPAPLVILSQVLEWLYRLPPDEAPALLGAWVKQLDDAAASRSRSGSASGSGSAGSFGRVGGPAAAAPLPRAPGIASGICGGGGSGEGGSWRQASNGGDSGSGTPSTGEPSQPLPRAASSGPEEEDGDRSCNAVLVFLPGLKEIQTLQELLLSSPAYGREPHRSWVLPLHSSVPPEDQRKAFLRPPAGIRKIILSTNIAETAITVDDVA